MTCARCGGQVPDGGRCPRCEGAHSAWRSFAGHRGERIAHLNALSTLLPHLHHGRVHDFRWAFVTGLTLVTALYLAGLIVAALLMGALLVPFLYLLYLCDAHLDRQEPVRFSVLTLVGGALLGATMALIVDGLQGVRALDLTQNVGVLLSMTVLVPVVQEVIKPVPALLLRGRAGFGDAIDGLTLGIAAGLGFGLAQTLVNFSEVIGSLPFRVDSEAWLYPLISAAVLTPLLQATCAGAATAALWSLRSFAGHRRLALIGLPVALVAHSAFALGAQLLADRGPGHVAVIAWQGLIVAAMIVFVRALLHDALSRDASAVRAA